MYLIDNKTKPLHFSHHWHHIEVSAAAAPFEPWRGWTSDIYACTAIKSLFLPIYERQAARQGAAIVSNLYLDLSEVQGSQLGWCSFCAKGETFILSPGRNNKMTQSFVFSFISESASVGSKLFCNTEKSFYSFGCCLAVFHSWNIALLLITSSLWDSTEQFCVCIWPHYSHSFHFKSCFFVLSWCPPSLLRWLQQSVVPEAIFDYTLLLLDLQETGDLIQGDFLSQGMARVHLWLDL